MSFQIEMQETATELIEEFGTPVKITQNSGDTAGSSKTTIGVLVQITADDIVDGFIEWTDKVCFIKGTIKFAPKNGDSVYFKTSKNTYTVISSETFNIDDALANTIAYRLILRP